LPLRGPQIIGIFCGCFTGFLLSVFQQKPAAETN